MNRKILFAAVMAAICAVSCQKMPSKVDADGECLVYTAHSENTDFSGYSTFTIVDSILVIGDNMYSSYLKNSFAAEMVASVKSMMESRGYEYVDLDNKDNADLGIQMSYVTDTEHFVGHVGGYSDPWWWLGYPGYWSPGYWGSWNSWYYSYPVTYSYSTHSLLVDMVDLTAQEGENESLPVLWNCYIDGGVSSGSRYDAMLLENGIEQAFSQSGYLSKN